MAMRWLILFHFLCFYVFDGRLALCFLICLFIFILLIAVIYHFLKIPAFLTILITSIYMRISFLVIKLWLSNNNINKSSTFTAVLLVFKLMSNFTMVLFEFRINIPVLHTTTKEFRGPYFAYSLHIQWNIIHWFNNRTCSSLPPVLVRLSVFQQ